MRWPLPLFLVLMLVTPSCATKVYHSTKSEPEMEADIKLCSDQANRKFWMDAIAALYHAYDCLEAKGYERAQAATGNRVERAVQASRKKLGPGEVCRVPC